jgi:hypothetical protein
MEMEKKKREPHHHLIIQKITSAPADCYSVWAWWEDDSKRETVRFEFSRVPCFAIVSRCQKAYEDQDRECVPDAEDQSVQPCVFIGDGRNTYLPIGDWYVNDCTNYKCIGIHYESSKEPPTDWQERALCEYDKVMATKARRAQAI